MCCCCCWCRMFVVASLHADLLRRTTFPSILSSFCCYCCSCWILLRWSALSPLRPKDIWKDPPPIFTRSIHCWNSCVYTVHSRLQCTLMEGRRVTPPPVTTLQYGNADIIRWNRTVEYSFPSVNSFSRLTNLVVIIQHEWICVAPGVEAKGDLDLTCG